MLKVLTGGVADMEEVRKPAVASIFYPDDTINLKRMINNYISNVPAETTEYFKKTGADNYFGIIVPHAGYFYSGQIASYAYALLKQKSIDTVILIGPSHFTYFEGFALSYYKSFQTPLGEVPVDTELINFLSDNGRGTFDFMNSAHLKEHSLEVQIPFLQTVLNGDFRIVPILMGEQTLSNVKSGAEILYHALKDYEKQYLFVISSDLSHYHDNDEAEKLDGRLIGILEEMNSSKLIGETAEGNIEACGVGPICTFLELAEKMKKTNIKKLIYKNSGDISGDFSKVVGYLSAVVW